MPKRVAVLYPFFSQQNKASNRFLFKSCGSTKMLRFIGEQLLKDKLVDEIRFVAPRYISWDEDLTRVVPANWIHECYIPPDNRLQRLTWFIEDWDPIFKDASVVFNMHELIGWTLKGLYPTLKMVNMFTVAPTGEPWPWMEPLIHLALRSGDLISTPSETMSDYIHVAKKIGRWKIKTWPLSFDAELLDEQLATPPIGKSIDILFVFRASSSNYTHHREFIRALTELQGWQSPGLNVAFTDTTRYLRNNPAELEDLIKCPGQWNIEILDDPGDQGKFINLMRRSRIVIGMNDNMHGGMGVREAMYCGALPVLLDAACYRELIGPTNTHYPAWIRTPVTPKGIAEALTTMLEYKDLAPVSKAGLRILMKERAARESFQYTWNSMFPTIVDLLNNKELKHAV